MDFNFTEHLLYRMFRVATRATLHFQAVSLPRMKELLELAAFDELTVGRGMNRVNAASHLGVVPGVMTRVGKISRPSATAEEEPLFLRVVEVLSEGDGSMAEVELHCQVLTGRYDPDDATALDGIEAADELALRRAIDYLVVRGILEKRPGHAVALTKSGRELIQRDLSRPLQKNTERLSRAVSLSVYLTRLGHPVCLEELEAAASQGMVPVPAVELEPLLAWCDQQRRRGFGAFFERIERDGKVWYAAPADPWVTPANRIESRQHIVLHLLEEFGEFLGFVAQEPPESSRVAAKTALFPISAVELEAFLVEHRSHVVEQASAAEVRASAASALVHYRLSWFGRVEDRGEDVRASGLGGAGSRDRL